MEEKSVIANVELTIQEVGLLRAGLAAHRIALEPYLIVNDQERRRLAKEQHEAARILSIRLGEIQADMS